MSVKVSFMIKKKQICNCMWTDINQTYLYVIMNELGQQSFFINYFTILNPYSTMEMLNIHTMIKFKGKIM